MQAQARRRPRFGVSGAEPEVDFAAVKDHVAEVIAAIAPIDSQARFEGLGCTVLRERARVRLEGAEVEAGASRVTARRFVIATGSRPLVPPIPGLDQVEVLTNETIFALRERPEHLMIVGGGPIGIEMAQAHRRLGSRGDGDRGRQGAGQGRSGRRRLGAGALRAEGVTILEGAKAERVSGAAGRVTVETSKGEVTGTHLLMAVGRQVALEDLGLEAAGVAYGPRGVKVDKGLRSVTNRRVYGGRRRRGRAAVHPCRGLSRRAGGAGRWPSACRSRRGTEHIPWCTYTDPELAQVG